jgi:hypothetical protein
VAFNLNEPWTWTEVDLQQLIVDDVTESLTLDYKRIDALKKADREKKEISKDVAAFANSAGGVIVYGVIEKGHLPEALDSGVDPAEISREWLENVIQSTIQRKIEGIRINQIPLTSTSPGNVAYVVHIPASERAPHMSTDNRYYKRYNFQSVPMEDYEVRDVANRRTAPAVSCRLTLRTDSVMWDEASVRSTPIQIVVNVYNESPAIAEYWTSGLLIDERLELTTPPDDHKASDSTTTMIGHDEVPIVVFVKNHSLSESMPIWRGSNFQIATLSFTVPAGDDIYYLGWVVNVSGAEMRHGHAQLKITADKVVLTSVE